MPFLPAVKPVDDEVTTVFSHDAVSYNRKRKTSGMRLCES